MERPNSKELERRELTRAEVAEQLRALGVQEGEVLVVHSSYRATRPIEGGPEGLVEALRLALGDGGTLVIPSWPDSDDEPFDPAVTPASADLGIVADTFWRMAGVRRSPYVHAFAAAGPLAEKIVGGSLPLPPHIPDSPIGRVHDLDGRVLLLGVGHDANTSLHLAELVAGVPYRVAKYCTVMREGVPVRLDYQENDHCCARFELADDWLRADRLQAEGSVGHAHARLFRSRDVVRLAVERLREDPLLFLHGEGEGCFECDRARASLLK
jgi:aminoglycoside 3-N-acetyltransferase IV